MGWTITVTLTTIIHLDSIYCGAHLIPVYGSDFLPVGFKHTWSLDAFEAFYVNKYADYHAYSVATWYNNNILIRLTYYHIQFIYMFINYMTLCAI